MYGRDFAVFIRPVVPSALSATMSTSAMLGPVTVACPVSCKARMRSRVNFDALAIDDLPASLGRGLGARLEAAIGEARWANSAIGRRCAVPVLVGGGINADFGCPRRCRRPPRAAS